MSSPRVFPVVVKPDGRGRFRAECPAIPGCFSEGETRAEALDNIRDAIELCLENHADADWRLSDDGDGADGPEIDV